jgi:septal ring factor EnvC (AmiA/AmiB activator)
VRWWRRIRSFFSALTPEPVRVDAGIPSKKKSSLSQQQKHKKPWSCPHKQKKITPKKAKTPRKQKDPAQLSAGPTATLESEIGALDAQEKALKESIRVMSKKATALRHSRDALKVRAYDALKRPNGKQGAPSASAGPSNPSPADARRVRAFFPLLSSDLNSS